MTIHLKTEEKNTTVYNNGISDIQINMLINLIK